MGENVFHETHRQGQMRKPNRVVNPDFVHDSVTVLFNCLNRYEQLVGDRLVGKPNSDQFQHFKFPLGQLLKVLPRLNQLRQVINFE